MTRRIMLEVARSEPAARALARHRVPAGHTRTSPLAVGGLAGAQAMTVIRSMV